jgi:hypothetical protein
MDPWAEMIFGPRSLTRMNAGVLTGATCRMQAKKKPGLGRAFWRTTISSACDLHQMSSALDRAATVSPLDVGLITDDSLDNTVGTLQYPETADQIDFGPHRNARTAGIEQAAKGRNHRRSLKQGVIGLRVQQAQAVLELTQVLGLRKKCLDLAIFPSGQIVIDGIQQFAKYVHIGPPVSHANHLLHCAIMSLSGKRYTGQIALLLCNKSV